MTNNTPDYEDNLYFYDYVSGIKVEKSDKLIKENAQLKELLKECFIAINEGSFWDECEVLHKINKALGEE